MDSSLFKYKKSPDVRTTTSFTLRKKFVTNLGLMIFLNLLIKPLWIFGIDRHVHNLVGDDEFGFYQTLLNFSMLTIVTLDFGLTNFNNRNISQNHELIKKHFSNLVGLKFLLAIVYAIVIFSIALIMDYTDPRQIKLLGFLAFNQFLISFTLYLRSNISGLQLYKTNSFLSVLDRGLMLIICSIILFFGLPGVNFSIELYVFAQTSAYVITAIITFFIVFSKSGSFKINFNKVFYIAILKKIYPFALLALLMTLYTYIDQNMLNKLLPDGEGDKYVGIYYQGFRIFNAAYQFGLLFAFLLLPMFAKMIKQKESIHQMVLL
ncbi:oligosaccharide flippase family protein, partial [Bacteroidota bacterium]